MPSLAFSINATFLAAAFSPVASAAGIKPVSLSLPQLTAQLKAAPPSALIFDYDGTLTDRAADGKSLPASPEVLEGLSALARAGIPVGIVTGRVFNRRSLDEAEKMGIWGPLLSKIPADLRHNIFFSGSFNGEFVSFDAAGQVTAAFARGDARAAPFAAALAQQFALRGLAYPVRGRDWIYASKSDKESAARRVFKAMRKRGFQIDEASVLIVGDDFRVPGGSDAPLARALPRATLVSVGDQYAKALAGGVRRLGERGAAAAAKLIRAVLASLG